MKNIILLIVAFVLALSAFQDLHAQEVDVSNDWGYHYTCDCGCHRHPVNDYSGLNSLMARLADRNWNGIDAMNGGHTMSFSSKIENQDSSDMFNNPNGIQSDDSITDGSQIEREKEWNLPWNSESNKNIDSRYDDYISAMVGGKLPVGVPVYVFFKIGTTTLTDPSQMINVDAIAEVAKRWHLKVRVTGASDSTTGSPLGNESLSQKRAEYISWILQGSGVPEEKIRTVAEGGIDRFSPAAANRHCRVELLIE